MRRSLIAGLVLAVLVALATGLGGLMGLDVEQVALLGGAIGGALGLLPHQHTWGRIGGFFVGFVVAWIGYALRAALLPDSSNGRAVAAFLVVALCAVACAVSARRLPLWSALLGVTALVGAYEEIYINAPSQFIAESLEAGTTVLLAVALGYLAASVVTELWTEPEADDDGNHRENHSLTDSDQETSTNELGRLDGLMAGDKK